MRYVDPVTTRGTPPAFAPAEPRQPHPTERSAGPRQGYLDPRTRPATTYVLVRGSEVEGLEGGAGKGEDARCDHRAVLARYAAVPNVR
jgi:hypothetical protein